MPDKFKPIKFPADEFFHNSAVEWWYFNGHLSGEKKSEYAFMNCLFKIDIRKINIPFLKTAPFKFFYFSHSILFDIGKKKSYPRVNYVSSVSKDSFLKPLLFINYANPAISGKYFNSIIEETEKFNFHLETEDLDLKLFSAKKPLLLAGNGYLDLHSSKTYYYSLTNLKTTGIIKIGEKTVKVKGKSWMDHQWSNASFSKDKWTWFSIQLENNIEIVCFEYDDNKVKTRLADIIYPDGKKEHFNKVRFSPFGKPLKSPKTKAEYSLSWKIEIPSKNIELKAQPLIEKQEMLFGTINYWEGPVSVRGRVGVSRVKGLGFLELMGRPSKYGNLDFIKGELQSAIKKFKFI